VTIVEIDEETLATVGQWPWPRNRLADLVDAIAAQKPLAIGLDIYMPEPDQTSPDKVAANLPKSAAALRRRVAGPAQSRNHSRQIVARGADHPGCRRARSCRLRQQHRSAKRADPRAWHRPDRSVRRFDYVLASLPELQAAAHGPGVAERGARTGRGPAHSPRHGVSEKLVPNLPMEMLRLATGSSALDVFADASGVRAVGVADVQVPTQPGGDIWLHFASIRSTLSRYVSARDVLQGKVDPERIRDNWCWSD